MKEPLEKKFQIRAKGTLQNKAAALSGMLKEVNGKPLVDAVDKTNRHTAQLALEFLREQVPLIRSYAAAAPVLGHATVLSRKKNAALDAANAPNAVDAMLAMLESENPADADAKPDNR
jgi:folylpolyglutamate synthase/dihydropteroate synthase